MRESVETCCECGAPAIKHEDFAIFDYVPDRRFGKSILDVISVQCIGVTRISLCRKCIDQRHHFPPKSELKGWNKQKALDKEIAEYHRKGERNFKGEPMASIVSGILDISNQKVILNAGNVVSAVENGMNLLSDGMLALPGLHDALPPTGAGKMRGFVTMSDFQRSFHRRFENMTPPLWMEPLYQRVVEAEDEGGA